MIFVGQLLIVALNHMNYAADWRNIRVHELLRCRMSTEQDVVDAAISGDCNRLQDMLAASPGLAAARNPAGISALMLALYNRQDAAVQSICAARDGFDVFEAASLGRIETLQNAFGEHLDVPDLFSADGFTPLHLAAFFARTTALEYLLEMGADSGAVARNPMHVQPLHSAVAGGNTECVRLLLEHGADPDARQAGGYTPLMGAAANGNLGMVRVLLEYGANPSLVADDGQNAHQLAIARGMRAVADVI